MRHVVAKIRDATGHHAAGYGDTDEGAKGVNQFAQISLVTALSRLRSTCNVTKAVQAALARRPVRP
jgi:hypothetical protein